MSRAEVAVIPLYGAMLALETLPVVHKHLINQALILQL